MDILLFPGLQSANQLYRIQEPFAKVIYLALQTILEPYLVVPNPISPPLWNTISHKENGFTCINLFLKKILFMRIKILKKILL